MMLWSPNSKGEAIPGRLPRPVHLTFRMEEWLDAQIRMPQEGEHISLPGIKGTYEVKGPSLYNNKGRLSIPLCLVEKYKLEQ